MLRRSSRPSTMAKTSETDSRVSKRVKVRADPHPNPKYMVTGQPPISWIGNRDYILTHLLTPIRRCSIVDELEFSFSTWGVTDRTCVYMPLVDYAIKHNYPTHECFKHYMVVIADGSSDIWEYLGIPETHVSTEMRDRKVMSFVPSYGYQFTLLANSDGTIESASRCIWNTPEFPLLQSIITDAFVNYYNYS